MHTASPTGRKGGNPNRSAVVLTSGHNGSAIVANTYWQKLKDPRWQRKRLEALEKANFHCENCYDDSTTLHVHHKAYFKGRDPWEYEVSQLAVLCENCHQAHHEDLDLYDLVGSFLPIDGPNCRHDMAGLVAGAAGQQPGERLVSIHGTPSLSHLVGGLAGALLSYVWCRQEDLQLICIVGETDIVGLFNAMVEYAKGDKA